MLLNRGYYFLKPVIPTRLRVFLRRVRADRRRKKYADVWPINPAAGVKPPGWPGWPDDKRFALVLTHDVEFTKGFNRIEPLMELERQRGFRSSFNLIPERDYRVSNSLVNRINDAGFEVGVHGLKHDGKLYSSKREFAARAARIREYMHDWNASGFRSPLMQHNLAWQHLLGAEYDSSTFDTDPFEPEPDGAETIFPFWVPGPDGSGFVELPYTLIQDFNLFVVLREQNIDIWKKKLDWIASRGGMALLNTHPDYMAFNGTPDREEFPVSYYAEFLDYVREKYEGQYWHALPREVSGFYRSAVATQDRNTRRKVCMVTYSNYENDTRVRRYAETLARRGDLVDVIAITSNPTRVLGSSHLNGVGLQLIQRRQHDEAGKWEYARRLLRFLVASSAVLTRQHGRKRYDLIHVHNIPDFLVFSAWYPKLTGAGVVLDIHDLVPELFANKFTSRMGRLYSRVLKFMERTSAKFAHHVIIANDIWRERIIQRSVEENRCSVFLNHIDSEVFYRRKRTRDDGKYIVIFPGSWQWHQGLDIAIRAMHHLRTEIPHAELHLYGGGSREIVEHLRNLVKELNLERHVRFFGDVSVNDVANVIANADVGVVPKRADSFGNEAYSTKIMEFMSQGLPVVASRTKIDTFYFDDTVVRFFPSGDSRALADAILSIYRDSALRASLIENGLRYAEMNNWQHRKFAYLDLADSLCTKTFFSSTSARQAQVSL